MKRGLGERGKADGQPFLRVPVRDADVMAAAPAVILDLEATSEDGRTETEGARLPDRTLDPGTAAWVSFTEVFLVRRGRYFHSPLLAASRNP